MEGDYYSPSHCICECAAWAGERWICLECGDDFCSICDPMKDCESGSCTCSKFCESCYREKCQFGNKVICKFCSGDAPINSSASFIDLSK